MIHRSGSAVHWGHSNGRAKVGIRKSWLSLWLLGAIGLLLLLNLGCGQAAEDTAQEVQDAASEAAQAASEAIGEGVEAVGEAVEEGTEAVGDAIEDAKETAEGIVDDAQEAVEEAGKAAKKQSSDG